MGRKRECKPPSLYFGRWPGKIGRILDWIELTVGSGNRRRTHQSGPLGELFDHGVDALNTSLECLIFAASQNLGMGWKTVMVLFACVCPSLYPPRIPTFYIDLC
jgi:hypothetical protein